MLIALNKLSNDSHSLRITRENGTSEKVTCETRSYLKHDLLHFAVESTAQLKDGFWGSLASGKYLNELNDRTKDVVSSSPIEQIVGVLHNIETCSDIPAFLESLKSQGEGLGWTVPTWLDDAFLHAVQERMRQLLGQWKATPFGDSMEIHWEK